MGQVQDRSEDMSILYSTLTIHHNTYDTIHNIYTDIETHDSSGNKTIKVGWVMFSRLRFTILSRKEKSHQLYSNWKGSKPISFQSWFVVHQSSWRWAPNESKYTQCRSTGAISISISISINEMTPFPPSIRWNVSQGSTTYIHPSLR